MKKDMFKRGFTLIELLVVIAIIGILAAVVLASLSSAREKGAIAAYKSEVQQIVNAAALECDDGTTGSYSHTAGSQTSAVTIQCSNFVAGTTTDIPKTGNTTIDSACVGSVSLDGAKFTTQCGN